MIAFVILSEIWANDWENWAKDNLTYELFYLHYFEGEKNMNPYVSIAKYNTTFKVCIFDEI